MRSETTTQPFARLSKHNPLQNLLSPVSLFFRLKRYLLNIVFTSNKQVLYNNE